MVKIIIILRWIESNYWIYIKIMKESYRKKVRKCLSDIKKSTSSSFRFWKILENGTKIGYRGINDHEFLPQKIFNLAQIDTE